MNAISSWQAVLTELGSELAPCSTPGAAVHTPAAAQGHRETEFYTPLASAYSGTPVDAWYSILTTLKGDNKAANRRNADLAVSPGSRTSASPRAQNSPADSPSMVRQLFASAQRGTRQGPIASSPTRPRAFTVAATEAAAAKLLPGSQTAGAAANQGGEAAARQAQCYHSSTVGCSTASSPQHRGHSPGASDTQQLADRITNLRASAESLLHSVSHALGPTAATASGPSAVQHASRSCSTQQDPLHVLSSSSTAQQDALLPRQLFQSPTQLRAPHSSPSTTRQRLPSPAHGSRGAGSSQHSSSTEAWHQGHAADTQGQEPLQQQLTGALRKVDNLLAGMAQQQQQQQQQPTPRPHSNSSSSRHGNHGLPLSAVSRPAGAVQQYQEQRMMLHHQNGAGQAQEQQQHVLQQLLLQQQQLLQQLMPLIPRADGAAQAETSSKAVGITAFTTVPQGLQQAALAAGFVQQQGNPAAASFTGSQGGSSLAASMQYAASAASTQLQGSNSSTLGDVLQQQQHQAPDGQTAAAALCRPGAMLVEELHRLQQTSVTCVSHGSGTHTGSGSAEDGAGGGEGVHQGLGPPCEAVTHLLAVEHRSSQGNSSSSSIVQQLEPKQGIQLNKAPSAAANTTQADIVRSSSNGSGSRFGTCSSEGSGSELQLMSSAGGVSRQPQAPDVAAGVQLQHPGVSSWASNLQTSTENDTSSAAASAEEQQQLPDTPTASLPRVHTPGKPAAEVAAELSTPQLANSTAAIMTVSEAWRDESSSNQDKWQQLLAEWSAAEVDTWDDQRLTEQSAYFGRESCHSGPGQQASRAGSSSQQQQHPLPEQQQQQQYGLLGELAPANGQQQQQPGRSMQEEGWQPEPQQQQHRQLQEEEQEQEHEVSFVFRGEQSSSPERMPAAVAPGPATHSIPASTAGAGAGQEGFHACSAPAAAPPEQQQQREWDQAGAAAQQQSPAWPDSTRKQLFASVGSTSTSSSRSDLELVLRPTSQPNSTHGSKDDQAELAIHQQAAVSHTGSSQSAMLTTGVLAAATPAATAAAGGSQQAPVSSAADSPAVGTTPQGQSSQQQQQQQLGVDRLNRLMLDLRGLQQRLNTIQLQTPRHTTRSPGDTSSGSTPAGTARTATSTDSVLPAATALPPTGQLVTPAAAAASSLSTGGPGSGRAAAAAGRGGVVTTPASAPVQYSAGVTSSGRAAASIALLKQRLQDSRAALQAIATPRQAEQSGPAASAPAGGAVQALQQAYNTGPRAAAGAEQPAVQLHTPVAGAAGGAGAGAALQSYSSPLLQPGSAAGGWGLQGAVPAGEPPAGQPGVHGMSHMPGQGIAGISAGSTSRVVAPASSAAPTAAGDTAAAAAATAALSAGGPLRSASAWLTGGSLQQYLDRSRRTSRASSTQVSTGGAANPASAPSAADTPAQTDPNSHVQGLVHKWRAAAAATASTGAGAGPQQQQPYGLSKAGHLGKQPQQQSLGSTHTTPRGLCPPWGPVQAAAAAGATGRTGSVLPAATGWLSNSMSASTQAPVRHSGSQGRPDTGAVLRGFAASPTAGLVSPPSLLMFDGSCSHNSSAAAAAAAAGMSSGGPGTTHSGRQFTLPWPLSARGTQDTAASGIAQGAALGMQYTPRNMVTPASGASAAYGSGGSRGDGSSTARSTSSALQGLHAGGLTPRGLRSSTPPSASSLTQWVQQGSPTSQLKQRLRTAALQHQALQQQQEQQRVASQNPAAATLAKNLATVDRTLAGLHSTPLATPRRKTALPARQQGAWFSSGHRPNTGPHGNSSGSNMAQAARSPSAVLAATAAAAEAAKSSLSGDAARARAARSTSPLQKLRMQQEALAMSSSTQRQGQRNPVVPVARSTAAAARMPFAASYSTVALGQQR